MNENVKYIGIRALRFCVCDILFVLISSLTYYALYFVARRTSVEISEDILRAMHIVLGIMAFHILHKAFIITDASARCRYYNNGNPIRFFLFKSADAAISLLLGVVCLFAFPLAFSVTALREWSGFSFAWVYLILLGALLINLTITWMIGMRDWKKVAEKQSKTRRTRKEVGILARYIASTAFTFPVLGYILPILFPSFRTLPQTLLVILRVVLPVFLAVWVFLFLLGYIRAFCIRFQFLRKLNKIAKANGYTCTKIMHPYRSILWDFDGCSFSLIANGKTYACKLLAGKAYGDPMYFLEEGKGVIIRHYTLRFRSLRAAPFAKNAMMWQKFPDDLAQIHTDFTYDFEAEGKKILIVCPTPHTIYASGYGVNKLLDVGDTFHGYMLMTGTAFINALERDAI